MLMAAQLFTALGGVWLATRGHDQRVAVTVMYLVALGGFFGCMQAPPSWVVPSVILLGLGQGGTFSIGLLMIVLRANTSRRSEERRVGKEWVSKCKSGGSPDN